MHSFFSLGSCFPSSFDADLRNLLEEKKVRLAKYKEDFW
jgi:hypothetical protein